MRLEDHIFNENVKCIAVGSLLIQHDDCLCLYRQSDPLRGLCNIIRRWLSVESVDRDSMFCGISLHSDSIGIYKLSRCLRGAADLLILLTLNFEDVVTNS